MEKGPRRREKNVMKGKEEEKNIKNKRVLSTKSKSKHYNIG